MVDSYQGCGFFSRRFAEYAEKLLGKL